MSGVAATVAATYLVAALDDGAASVVGPIGVLVTACAVVLVKPRRRP